MSEPLKLGKRPHTPDSRDLRLSNYLDHTALPTPPDVFGYGDLVREDEWGVLGNDVVGCCVWAGAAHEEMVLGREGHHHPSFTTKAVIADYSRFTGYVPGDESTDQGTDVRQAARDRRKVGISDGHGHHYKIGAYLWLKPGNVEQLWHALYIFGAVGVGYQFPASAMQQFNEGKPWDVVRGSRIEGGHYVPAIGRRAGRFIDAVSWGRRVAITPAFYEAYCDSALVYVDNEALNKAGRNPLGLNQQQLLADLAALKASGEMLFPMPPTERERPLHPLCDPAAA